MATLNRRRFLTLAGGCALIPDALTASNRAVDKDRIRASQLESARLVQRPDDAMLAEYEPMVYSYTAASGEGPTTMEIDYIGNESGSDKLPNDLGQFARNVIEKIGHIQTYRALPEGVATPRPAGIALPSLLRERPKPPAPNYRLVGSLERATEALVKGRKVRGDGMVHTGATIADFQIQGDRNRTITALTVALTLEKADGTAIPGATAEYRIDVEKSERNRSVSVYIGGSGGGLGSSLIISQESADALYSCLAMGIVHVTGAAMGLPYFRTNSNFLPDQTLEARVRDGFTRMTQSQLEQVIKRYMIVDGFHLDRGRVDLSDLDRAIVLTEMRHRSLIPADRMAMVDLLMQLWSNMEYRGAAKRVTQLLADSEWRKREELEKLAREQAELVVSPAEFGWAESARVVVLDMSRVKDRTIRDTIVTALRRCSACGEIRVHPKKDLLGISLLSKTSEVQFALRNLKLECVWFGTPSPRMLIVPAK